MDNKTDKLRSRLIGVIKVILRILRQPRQYLARHQRCLFVAAVIFIIFGTLNYADLQVKDKKETPGNKWWQSGNELIEETAADLNVGIMGGALNLTASAIPVAQVSVDFSADDELENQDLAIMEGSGLLSPEMSGNAFFGMPKEAATYIVQEGDSPFSIAVKFGISTYTVLAANNLREGDYIKPGQSLIILPINGVRVKVAAKDTIASLAKKYKGEEDEIKTFNGIYEDTKLVAGNFIIIPDGELTTTVLARATVTAPKYSGATPFSGGWLIAPTTGKNWGRLHGSNAVDIANACGTPIYAAAAGTVILSDGIGWNFGYGKYIMIRHANGVVTVYGHAASLLVGVGEKVGQGQLIALIGTTGRSSGCHLHFEVRGAKNPLAGAKTIK
ncbi:peptidoglycan DD-metalloendopeptidase family protein [Patescibacteria group bacterium]|nr:peptidoglycan DD-metalloendopeptidase family protein [Patescibacteria group bacterium]